MEGNIYGSIHEVVPVIGTAGAVAQNATVYSETINLTENEGFIGIQLTSSAGSITVTQQCSFDGTNWYDPVDGNGSAIGKVAADMTFGTKYIQPDPVLAHYARYKVVEGNVAATVVSMKIVFLRKP